MDGPPTLPAAEVERWLDGVSVGSADAGPVLRKRVSFNEHVQTRTISDVSLNFTDITNPFAG